MSGERCGVASGKALIKFAGPEFSRVGLRTRYSREHPEIEGRVGLKARWGERGAGRFTHTLIPFTWEMVGQSHTASSQTERGVGWMMSYQHGAER
jgi:hypothetical protein